MTFDLQHNSDVTEAMKDAQLLTINNLYNLEIAQMMFKYENKQLPPAFNNFFTQKSLKMKTRSNSQIISNCFRTKVSQQSVKFGVWCRIGRKRLFISTLISLVFRFSFCFFIINRFFFFLAKQR